MFPSRYGVLPSNTCPGSALIAGVPNVSLLAANVGGVPVSADQEYEAGFFCGPDRYEQKEGPCIEVGTVGIGAGR
jgi:hypothetical protein